MCVLRNSTGGCEESEVNAEKSSPSHMDEMYAKFQKWHEQFADNIEDMGGKLISEGKVITGDGVVDGPFMEVKEIVGGFMIVRAEQIDEAIEVVKACPPVESSLGNGTTVEVRELAKG